MENQNNTPEAFVRLPDRGQKLLGLSRASWERLEQKGLITFSRPNMRIVLVNHAEAIKVLASFAGRSNKMLQSVELERK